ncbi:MAG: ScpA family protein [Euryarchaeota archaeon]|nr:ScpA family protein [Euryarchaeota archaeon]
MNTVDADFLEMLQSLGVNESQLELSEDVLCEPVEILVTLARNQDINPWDIDIVDVTDKFLALIEERKLMDLRISGRTLLYAAILLRMKSTGILKEEEEPDLFDDEMDFYDVEEYPVPKLPIRRTATRPVTLQELITELKKAETVESRRRTRKMTREFQEIDAPTMDDVLEIAHEEDVKGRMEGLELLLEDLFGHQKCVAFSDLVRTESNRSERIMTYISLLFLAADKRIWLKQKELFAELYIHPPNAADNTAEEGEA